MFENVPAYGISVRQFNKTLPELRQRLLAAQRRVQESNIPVIVLFAGVDGAGKHELASSLNEWMDPRWIVTRVYGDASDEEDERPEAWRYWRDMPPKGQIGLFLSAWYSGPLLDQVYRRSDTGQYQRELERIATFEKMLHDDGVLVLKFWMHLDQADQKARLEALDADPVTNWQVKISDWTHWALYDRFIAAAEPLIEQTTKPGLPWHVVNGVDESGRAQFVCEQLLLSIEQHLAKIEANSSTPTAVDEAVESSPPALAALDMTQTISKAEYRQQLPLLQGRLNQLQRRAEERGVSTVLVFEGWDAAGKGGAIRRLVHALDARYYRVVPIAAPTEEERAQHYLWRFWRHIPRAGRVTIFDRSWYGRVLVERIEGFASDDEWQRAYAEINDFEQQLAEHDTVICKFWIHISNDEQLQRFEARGKIPHKAWKLTDEDWRNRDRWDDYEQAVNDFYAMTSTVNAPWILVEGNQKNYARLKVIQTVCDRLEAALA